MVSVDGINGSGGAAAAVRASGVGIAQAVRPRFGLPDPFQVSRRQGGQRSQIVDDSPDGERPSETFESRRKGDSPAARSFSAFVAQSLAQELDPEDASAAPSLLLAGAGAYARSADAARRQDEANVEILPPALSSGHTLDLLL
jgi:hypothetical protein